MKECPYCAEEIRVQAVKCRYCGSYLEARARITAEEWTRNEDGRMIAGVCAGLARRFEISVTVIRLAFVVAALLGFGTAIILYGVLWIVMPVEAGPDYELESPERAELSSYTDDGR
jgi:phage shock protein PspC (stress-responsive transcriptional regulator)